MRINKNLSDFHKIISINTEDFYDAHSFLADLPAELYQQGVAFCEYWRCGLKKELDGVKKEVLKID